MVPEENVLRERVSEQEPLAKEVEKEDDKLKKQENVKFWRNLEKYLVPLVFTIVAVFVRCYKLHINAKVTWDEAHFGKFGSYYLRGEFYHDVHPPLGKMLVGLSGYLAGYNGSWDFPSGQDYPDYIDYTKMRLFQGIVSAMCVPMSYFAAKAIGFALPTVWLVTVLVLFESSYTTLGKFILLDSLLLFFTVATFMSFQFFHRAHKRPFTAEWWTWIALTGVSMGCAISVKMVGLFVISLVGIHTVVDLWQLLGDKSVSWKQYAGHWLARIIFYIVTPFLIFALCFKIHFHLLCNSGPGDGTMSSRFQAALKGSNVGKGPRDIAFGSSVTFRNMDVSHGALLHSHVQTYPEGSEQQQVTAYGYNDTNNVWIFHRGHGQKIWDTNETEPQFVKDGDTIRLIHALTRTNLHSHPIFAPVTKDAYEVSCYASIERGDDKDHWIVEVMLDDGNEDKSLLHPITTKMRFKHSTVGCYLAQTGKHLPDWGYKQAEVACVLDPKKNDMKTWWTIESHSNEMLPTPENFTYPRSPFWGDFFALNKKMMDTNNALTVASDKHDYLKSEAWEWPTLYRSLRINHWGEEANRYLLLGSPASVWPSTLSIVVIMLLIVYYLLKWQRQQQVFRTERDEEIFLYGGLYPLLGWGLHYAPFVIMGRIKYLHHYMPALYFALFVLAYMFDASLRYLNKTKSQKAIRLAIYFGYMALVIGGFIYFAPFSYGMTGPFEKYKKLDWLKNWHVV
ncbi:Dolichyl-phosphate-mannose--protein mannosyltransferase 2 [Nakaseomyces bracarensis]|uniref:Dolichyl-phosphate-mannose--protein mannosyltransferase n=1 Tax=Nakaseomyces bracarensis TaxID=273131 RepID=A0ABR4NZA6_9SACH